MAHLGDFTSADVPADEEHTFAWFSETVRAHPELSDTSYVDFIDEYGSLEATDPKAAVAVKAFMRAVIHPGDFDLFWSTGKKHRVKQEQFAEVANSLIEAITKRPTERPNDSSVGQSRTAMSSTGDSYSRVIKELETEGRPDLALVYDEARTVRAS